MREGLVRISVRLFSALGARFEGFGGWMMLGAVGLGMGLAAGCGAGGTGSGGGGGPVKGETTQVSVVVSSSANDQLVRYGLTLNSLTLTNHAGTTVPVLSTPQQVEFMHLNGSAEPLVTVAVPQDIYTSATATVGGAGFTCIVQQSGSDGTSTYAYGATPNNQVTVNLPEPLTVDGKTMAVSLEMLVSQSASFPSACLVQGIPQYSITPTFDLAAMPLSAQPTDPTNGKLTALEGLVVSAGTTPGSLTVAAADGTPPGTTMSSTWQVTTDANTVFQGIGNAAGLTAGVPVDLDGVLGPDGSVEATRVAVADTDTTNLVVNQGPLMQVASAVPILMEANQEEEGSEQYVEGWPSYNFSDATFATWGGLTNTASLPFAASFNAANMVPGQMVAITSHVTGVEAYPTYVPAAVVTLMPQTIDATVEQVGTASGFTTYTVELAPYDVFPQFAVQGGQTTLLTNPAQVVVYADANAAVVGAAPAAGSVGRFRGVIFNDGGTLRMDCFEVAAGVTE